MAPPLRCEDYTVGWVCALPVELAAAQQMLDEEHETPPHGDRNNNIYQCGRVGNHNVVIACLPLGQTGTNSAATVASKMMLTFASTRFCLMVGIGGGVPNEDEDIRLGDVVISKPHGTFGGVVQFDFGKSTESGFARTGSLNSPPGILLTAVSHLEANDMIGRSRLMEFFSNLKSLPAFEREAAGLDTLFEATFDHAGGGTCSKCSKDHVVDREARAKEVVVHYGTIASGNRVMRSGFERDRVSTELGGVLCFEMEAAGLMNNSPCLVIRGICDYADSHKNKAWQPYAAGTAAACAKEVLSIIPAVEVAKTHTAEEKIQDISAQDPEEVSTRPQKETPASSKQHPTAPLLNVQSKSMDQHDRNEPRFGCQTCDRKSRILEAANSHMDQKHHWSIKSFKCRTCERKFTSNEAANQHMIDAEHNNPKVSCKKCKKMFYTKSAADQHMADHGVTTLAHRTLTYSCNKCPQKFQNVAALKQHTKDKAH